MSDNFACADPQQSSSIVDDQFLAVITNLFIEGMEIERKSQPRPKGWDRSHVPWQPRQNVSITSFPSSKQTQAIALKEYGTRKAEPNNVMRKARKDGTAETIRTFILGLSDAFNNLMMGIWGNLSLINLTGDKSETVFQRIAEMEHIIQNGSAFINAVFGYLGERRIVAKNIRLNQLIQDINGVLPFDGDRVKRDILQASLNLPATGNSAAGLASNLSRMLRQFVERLQYQYDLTLLDKKPTRGLLTRLPTVGRLIIRAWDIISLLNQYTGAVPLQIKRTSAKTVITRLSRNFETRYPQLTVTLDLARRLPSIEADRSQLQFVLNQMMENAAGAMPRRGRLLIEASAIKAEPPRNRCVARRWSDSIVITVSDTGHGMDLKTLMHVFDPFFTDKRNSGRLGMGMAASWGIVKAHGGYIHVRSKLGHGSTFKIYLPTNTHLLKSRLF